MMILIKDLNMPDSCANCTFNRYSVCLVKIKVSSIIGKPEWCPLVDAEKNLDAEYDKGFDNGLECAKQERKFQKGLQAAWEAAKKIVLPCGLNLIEKYRIFGTISPVTILESNTAAEAIAKIGAYEEKQKVEAEIIVGDEIVVDGLTVVVMRLDEKGNVDRYFTYDGKTYSNISGFQNNEVKKNRTPFLGSSGIVREDERG